MRSLGGPYGPKCSMAEASLLAEAPKFFWDSENMKGRPFRAAFVYLCFLICNRKSKPKMNTSSMLLAPFLSLALLYCLVSILMLSMLG